MKPFTIAVSVKNREFAEDLVRGLSALDRPYYIEISGEEGIKCPEKKWEVLIADADRNNGLTACFEPYRVIRAEEDTCRISQLSSRIDAAVRQHRDGQERAEGGEKAEAQGLSRTRVVVFQSFWGGAGTTSLAVAAGRMLSGAYGERVLYLPLTPRDGSLIYRSGAEAENSAEGSGMELFYRMRNGRPFCFREYAEADFAGMEYLSWGSTKSMTGHMSDDEKKQLVSLAASQDEYDWILADLGTENLNLRGNVRVIVDNLQDCRTVIDRNENETGSSFAEIMIVIQNRGLENRMEQGRMELIDDGESFVTSGDEKAEIVLSKSYAAGVKIFSEWLLETVGNSVEMW